MFARRSSFGRYPIGLDGADNILIEKHNKPDFKYRILLTKSKKKLNFLKSPRINKLTNQNIYNRPLLVFKCHFFLPLLFVFVTCSLLLFFFLINLTTISMGRHCLSTVFFLVIIFLLQSGVCNAKTRDKFRRRLVTYSQKLKEAS